MQKYLLVVTVLFISALYMSNYAYADNLINARLIHALVSNTISIYGKTYNLHIDNKTIPVYYGFNSTYASASSMQLDKTKNSLLIKLQNVTEIDGMWIQFPQSLISASDNNFILYVDGTEKKYEFATSDHANIMGFMVPAGVNSIEIKGTTIIPEFETFALSIMMTSFLFLLLLNRFRTLRFKN